MTAQSHYVGHFVATGVATLHRPFVGTGAPAPRGTNHPARRPALSSGTETRRRTSLHYEVPVVDWIIAYWDLPVGRGLKAFLLAPEIDGPGLLIQARGAELFERDGGFKDPAVSSLGHSDLIGTVPPAIRIRVTPFFHLDLLVEGGPEGIEIIW